MILMTPKMTVKCLFYHQKIIPIPRIGRVTLCSALWRLCDLWPQDKGAGTAATVRWQGKSTSLAEAPTTGLLGTCFTRPM